MIVAVTANAMKGDRDKVMCVYVYMHVCVCVCVCVCIGDYGSDSTCNVRR